MKGCYWLPQIGEKLRVQLSYTRGNSTSVLHKTVDAIVVSVSKKSLELDIGAECDRSGYMLVFRNGKHCYKTRYYSEEPLNGPFHFGAGMVDFLPRLVIFYHERAREAALCFLLVGKRLPIHRNLVPIIARLVYDSFREELTFMK